MSVLVEDVLLAVRFVMIFPIVMIMQHRFVIEANVLVEDAMMIKIAHTHQNVNKVFVQIHVTNVRAFAFRKFVMKNIVNRTTTVLFFMFAKISNVFQTMLISDVNISMIVQKERCAILDIAYLTGVSIA